MSDATTALAEVLRAHHGPGLFKITHENPADETDSDYCLRGDCACGEVFEAHVDARPGTGELLLRHQAAAVVAAVRGLSPDLQAELIDGEVERRWADNGSTRSIVDRVGNVYTGVPGGSVTELRRVVTPWTTEPSEEMP